MTLKPSNKIKVNDKVIAKQDIPLTSTKGDRFIIKKGTTGIVNKLVRFKDINIYNVKFKGYECKDTNVSDTDIELAIKPESCKAVVNQFSNKLMLTIANGKNPLIGVARCNPEDKFDFKTGLLLAIARAYDDKKLEEYALNPDMFTKNPLSNNDCIALKPKVNIKGIKPEVAEIKNAYELRKCKRSEINDDWFDALLYALLLNRDTDSKKKGD